MTETAQKHTRLDRANVERQIHEMWDALAGTPQDETAFDAVSQAQKIEANLRDRLAAQDRLDEAARDLLLAAKLAEAVLARTEAVGNLHATRAFEDDRRALAALRQAIAKAGEQP